ncbi:MAPEG family protein [Phyllobacterium sp. 21LDTY02-6]|uniref:MAPEG family protein n=1 Tax=Phyllobacterium sp. 21LDTY02-6 TaxID=2944903 RepID=UPI0020202AB2|nr:MAPEG family protein [Phyllobacterium sp. 21LDTY02-6]MCO4318625.1 MAPEG family protein [Phyllobacterium sp. 21LDTY02-6]
MAQTAIFWPMIALTALIYAVYGLLLVRRAIAVRAGQAKPSDFRIPLADPQASATTIRNLVNLFELPVLFYVVCLALYMTRGADMAAVIVAWLFVGTRFAHTLVHTTTNRLCYRQVLFALGFILNGLLWLLLALHLLLPPAA